MLKEMLGKIAEAFPEAKDADKDAEQTAGEAGDPSGESPLKKRKIGSAELPDESKLLVSVACPTIRDGKNVAHLKVYVDFKKFLVNQGNTPISWTANVLLAGFGVGKYEKTESKESLKENDVLYTLTSSSNIVLLQTKLVKLGEVLQSRQQTHPTSEILYHKLVPMTGQSGFYHPPRNELIQEF